MESRLKCANHFHAVLRQSSVDAATRLFLGRSRRAGRYVAPAEPAAQALLTRGAACSVAQCPDQIILGSATGRS